MAEEKIGTLNAPASAGATADASDERAAIEAERKEIEALEAKVQTDEERFTLRKRREDLGERQKRIQKLADAEESRRQEEIDEKRQQVESDRKDKEKRRQEDSLRKQAEDEEKAFVADLCAVLPDDERNQLSWALFKIEPGKGESQVTNIPLSPELNIYDTVRSHCPEGGEFHLKLMKGGVFATRRALAGMVRSDEAKAAIQDMPLHFKVRLYEKDKDEYPREGYGRLRPEWGGVRRYGGYDRPPGEYYGLPGYRGGRPPITAEHIELQRDREREEREERKEMRQQVAQERAKTMDDLKDERDRRLSEQREHFNQQMNLLTTLIKEGRTPTNQGDALIKALQENHTGQMSLIRESYDKQMTALQDEVKRLREKAEAPPPADGKKDDSLAMFQMMKESSSIQATVLKESNEAARRASEAQANAAKDAAIAQAQAMKEATASQAEALKAALTNQADVQKQIISMQTDSMKEMVGRMMTDFKGTIENMLKQQERDREAVLNERKAEREASEKERERERELFKGERERDREMNKNMIELWREQATKKGGSEQMLDQVMKMASTVMTTTGKSIEAQLAVASKVNKMVRKMDREDEDEEEEDEDKKKSDFDKILDVVQPPLMKVLDIALEQARQGKPTDQIHAEAEKLLQEQMRNQAEEHRRRGAGEAEEPAGGTARRKETKQEDEGGGDMLESMLEEYRDDVIPVIVAAIEKNADEDWLTGMVMSPDFPPAARTGLALLPIKKVMEKLIKFATDEEKAVLNANGAVDYLVRIQNRMIEVQKKLKEAEREMEAQEAAKPAAAPAAKPAGQ